MKKIIQLVSVISVIMLVLCTSLVTSAEEQPKERPTYTIEHFNVVPTIDGKFSEAEWGKKTLTLAEGQPNVKILRDETVDGDGNTVEKPIESTTTDIYMGYDDTHFYLCVVAKYKNHKAMALLGSQLWKEDCIQTKISATPNGPNYNDIDFGINAETNRALGHVWNGHGVTASQLKAGKGNDFMIVRSGDTTVYEIAYPLKSFSTTTLKLREGAKMAFSIAQHMSGGGFYELVGGIVEDKDIANTAILVLGGSKNIAGSENTPTSSTSSTNSPQNNKEPDKTTSTVSGNKDNESNASEIDNTEIQNNASEVETEEEIITVVKKADNSKQIYIIIAVAAVAVIILGVAFYFLIIRKK